MKTLPQRAHTEARPYDKLINGQRPAAVLYQCDKYVRYNTPAKDAMLGHGQVGGRQEASQKST